MLNLLILLLFPYFGCNNLDIMILADYSGSVQGSEKFLYNSISSFEKGLDISEDNVNLGIVVFNSYSEVICSLESDPREIRDRIELLSTYVAGGTTNLSSALYSAFDEFATKGRDGYKKIIIIISDGQPDYGDDTYKVAQQVKSLGMQIYTILIDNNISNTAYMKSIASEGCFYNTDYEGLVKTLEQINLCL